MRVFLYVMFVMLAIPAAAREPPKTFSASKKLLAQIHEDIQHQTTLYCGCPYSRTTASGGDVDREACGLEAKSDDKRSDRVEWEHVVPASWFGRDRACWKTGHAKCVNSKGKAYKGRKCCSKRGVDSEFMRAYVDPHNLFPSSGEVNGNRSAWPFGVVPGEKRVYGQCDFEFANKTAEPATGVRGELARAMLYMADRYGVDVRMSRADLKAWHEADPAQPWEIKRAAAIAEKTGLGNPWVLE